MNYYLPFILTFLVNSSYSFLFSVYGFIHKDMIEVFKISQTELGILYGVSGIGTTIGTVFVFIYSNKIKQSIVTFYTYGCCGYVFFFLLLVLSQIIFGHPSKSIIFVLLFFIGLFRAIYFPMTIIIIKIHQQISEHNKVEHGNGKLLKSVWSTSSDVGIILGFFSSNFLNYSAGWSWEHLVILGCCLHLITIFLLLVYLWPYMQNQQSYEDINQSSTLKSIQIDLSELFSLIKKSKSTQLFMANFLILEVLHFGNCLVMPAFFYSIGYKGNQGYLLAIYSIAISVGSTILGFIDFIIDKIYQFYQKRLHNQQNQFESRSAKNQISPKPKNHQRFIYLVISSISLILFLIVQLILARDTFRQQTHINQKNFLSSFLKQQKVKVCLLGFLFGGPLKSYLSIRVLAQMNELKQFSQMQKIQQQSYNLNKHQYAKNYNLIQKLLKRHKLQIGSAFISLTRIFVHLGSVLFIVVAFFLIQKHIAYLFVFLSLFGLSAVVLDIIQDVYLYRRNKKQQKSYQGYYKVKN